MAMALTNLTPSRSLIPTTRATFSRGFFVGDFLTGIQRIRRLKVHVLEPADEEDRPQARFRESFRSFACKIKRFPRISIRRHISNRSKANTRHDETVSKTVVSNEEDSV